MAGAPGNLHDNAKPNTQEKVDTQRARFDQTSGTPTFLVNPAAGGGQAEKRLRRVLSKNVEFRPASVVRIRTLSDASRAVERLAADAIPVAVGGDGTVALVATAVLELRAAEPTLGILPLGTGNILACALGIRDIHQALVALRGRATARVDVMRTTAERAPVALVSLSAGFEARFIRRFAGLRRLGRGVGAAAGLWSAGQRTRGICLELDGQTLVDASDLVFSVGLYNTPYYAGGLLMSGEARLADGKAEAVVYRTARDYWRAVWTAFRRARDGMAPELRRQWSQARIASDHGLQVDGECVAADEIGVRVDPSCLQFRVPRPLSTAPAARAAHDETASAG